MKDCKFLVELVGGPRDGEVFWWEGGHIPLDICLPVKSLQPTAADRTKQMLNSNGYVAAFREHHYEYYTRRPTFIIAARTLSGRGAGEVKPWAPWPFDYVGRA